VLYTLRYTDMEQNKNNAELYVMPVAGGEAQRLTTTASSEFNPAWMDDDNILFCRDTNIVAMNLKDKSESVVAACSRGFGG
jgi:Tol biopolymer transport system component